MELAETSRTRPERQRIVVGEVRDRSGTVAHPVTERSAALVGDIPGDNRETLDRVLALLDRAECPARAEDSRLDREVRRRERPREHALGVGTLAGHQDLHPVARPGA